MTRITFWRRAHAWPPIVVRLLAISTKRAALTTEEIAAASGLTPWQVEALSQSTDWSGIDLPTMQRFLVACRVDFCNAKDVHRISKYLRNPKWKYLHRTGRWESYYQPLIRRWRESLTRKS